MTAPLPLLPTWVVGSHALPGWLVLGREAQAAGRLGPVDRRALIEDATRIALLDHSDCGLWATPRHSTVGKLRALVAGTRLGRAELGA